MIYAPNISSGTPMTPLWKLVIEIRKLWNFFGKNSSQIWEYNGIWSAKKKLLVLYKTQA